MELLFPEPVQGPVCLGANAHFGMGRFLPLDASLSAPRAESPSRATSGSQVPTQFRNHEDERSFQLFERVAPEWRQGRVPIILYRLSALTMLKGGVKQLARRWRMSALL